MHRRTFVLSLLLLALGTAGSALAQGRYAIRDLERIDRVELPKVDTDAILRADEQRAAAGQVAHYATPIEVEIDPFGDHGTWEVFAGEMARWRLRLASPGALSLNLAFERFRLPVGSSFHLTSADGHWRVGPMTERDNEEHGQLWTPPIPGDELVLELRLPIDGVDDALELELSQVNHGYAGFGEEEPISGPCHRDVACSEAEPWSDQVRSVALISVEGSRFCSGFLVNNTALDGRPFFITANHCDVTPRTAPSVVVLWNHEREGCGGEVEGARHGFDQFQTGAIWRAAHRASDTLLLELDDPPSPFGVFYAGWDRSAAEPVRSTVIHHPNTDVKRISFDFDRATTTAHLDTEPKADGDHLRIGDWDMGSTEGGSSGAPLFNRDRRVVGQLHGGFAACDEPRADWFGRLSVAWDGNGRPGTRLSDWLDPLDTGSLVLDGLDGSEIETSLDEAGE